MIKTKEVAASGLRAAANAISKGGKIPLHAMFANDERSINGNFCVYVLFSGSEPGDFSMVKGWIADGQPLEFPSITPLLPAAAWYEREIHDLFGITPVGHPDLRPLVLHDNWPQGCYPMRKDFDKNSKGKLEPQERSHPHVHGEGVFEVPVGPIHAGIIEPGHFCFSQAGENMIHVDPTLFFTHRGLEKSLEGLTAAQAIFRVERTCGACSVSHALSFSQAVESLVPSEIPMRALYIRVLAAELERVYNHVGDVGNICAGIGFAVGTSQGARQKEMLMRFNEELTGGRFLRGLIVPGGVAFDIPGDLIRQASSVINALEKDFEELVEIVQESSGVQDRVRRTGILPRQAAAELSIVGPAARASGMDIDLRRDHPYAAYNQLSFKVPVRIHGDVEDRLLLRVAEVRESCGIIKQALSALAETRGLIKIELEPAASWASGIGWSESARGANFHWVMLDANQKIYRCFIRSASYPNWPALAVAAPGNIIPDFPLINKSFELCYACLDR
ncbi:MAG TPA: NADH-quinone oxidoreductase subunit C [Negativicutes bacterium]|nr:NADH-quinone oxidoreductase subunit C [Negativicutes bacterium]